MSFNQEQWQSLLKETVEAINNLSKSKGAEYAHGDDRLDNFRRGAKAVGVSMEVVWRIYAGKHWDAITTYVQDINEGKTRERSEPITGRINDLIVYLILLKAMCVERGTNV